MKINYKIFILKISLVFLSQCVGGSKILIGVIKGWVANINPVVKVDILPNHRVDKGLACVS